MILPGEFKLTCECISRIIDSSEETVVLLEKAKDICQEKTDVQKDDYRFRELVAGLSISAKSFYAITEQGGTYSINLFTSMADRIKNQYKITIDQFLEEQFIEINEILYNLLPVFAQQNPTSRLGDKSARWKDIEVPINEMSISKYSKVRMKWSFIGAINTD